MSTNKELEKRIETLEKEVQHLKATLQYQIKKKKKMNFIYLIAIIYDAINLSLGSFV